MSEEEKEQEKRIDRNPKPKKSKKIANRRYL